MGTSWKGEEGGDCREEAVGRDWWWEEEDKEGRGGGRREGEASRRGI